jgi:hypothetical protein
MWVIGRWLLPAKGRGRTGHAHRTDITAFALSVRATGPMAPTIAVVHMDRETAEGTQISVTGGFRVSVNSRQ